MNIPTAQPEISKRTRPSATARRRARRLHQPPSAWYLRALTHFHPWLALALIIVAELLSLTAFAQLSMIVHALLLLLFTTISITTSRRSERRLTLALTLIPLTRILSLALPLMLVPQIFWPTLVGLLVLCSALIVRRELHLDWRQVGVRSEAPFTVVLLLLFGLGLGAIEARLLPAPAFAAAYSWGTMLLIALSFIVCTGFTEELVFRGLIQAVVHPVLGPWGIVYVALLFTALHIGYGSVIDLIFVFAVGLLFSAFVQSSKSLIGVSLSHGIANVTQFFLIPYLVSQPTSHVAQAISTLIWVGFAFSLLTLGIIMARHAHQQGTTWRLRIEIY